MKVYSAKNNQNFKGSLNNKVLLSGLEKISDHSASFVAGASFVSAVALRPLAISLTPKTKQENKKAFTLESISSALVKLLIAEMVALPIEKAVNLINNNPEKFLKSETIQKLSNKKDLKFLTQTIKQASNILTAIPKSMMTIAMMPILSMFLFKNKEKNEKNLLLDKAIEKENNFGKFNKNQVSFNGLLNDKLAKGIAGIIDNQKVQEFAIKNSINDKNIARNMSVASDVLLTASSVASVSKSKKIDAKTKKPLIFNKIISTLISIFAGCKIDEIAQKSFKDSMDKFINANKNNPKLPKYIEGINILRPTIVFALLYYGVIPIVSAYLSDKTTDK